MKKSSNIIILSIFHLLIIFLNSCDKDTFQGSILESKVFVSAVPTDISFGNKDIGYISGSVELSASSAVVAKTLDGGNSWQVFPVILNSEKTTLIRSLFAVGSDTIYATYTSFSDQGICFSKDGGVTWAKQISFTNKVGYTSILFRSSLIGFVCGGGDIMKTSNGGTNWSTVYDYSGLGGISNIIFTSKNIGYGFGFNTSGNVASGSIVKTIDEGDSWIELSNLREPVTCLEFLDDNIGYAFTFLNNIYKTNDGGGSWNLIKNVSDIGGSLYYVAIVSSPDKYFASGLSIYKTSDDFKNIRRIYSSPDGNAELSIKAIRPTKSKIFILSSQHSVIKIQL